MSRSHMSSKIRRNLIIPSNLMGKKMCMTTERKDLVAKRTLVRKGRQRERKFITYQASEMRRCKNELFRNLEKQAS